MLTSILVFLIVLSILVLVHELGHYWMARRQGVLVEEFGFGLPPKILGIKIKETVYSLNLFPFGGFVRLHGEDFDGRLKYPQRAFINKSKKTRFAIVSAGVVMNFILAVLAFGVVYSFSGIPKETKKVKVVEIAAGSPAQVGGLVVGDIITKVDKQEISTVKEFVDLVEKKKGKSVIVETQDRKITLKPRENPPQGEGPLGVVITTTEIYYPPFVLRPFYGIYYGFKEAVFWGKNVAMGFWQIISGLFAGKLPSDIAGPVGIFAITAKAAQYGILAVVNFVGIMSVNLAILNVMPFPALDGGRLLFIGIEKAIGRKILPKIEAAFHTAGMIILLLLLLAITAHDIQRLIAAGGIAGFGEKILK